MRPLRFLLLLGLFVVLPIILTCVSLFSSRRSDSQPSNVGYHSRHSRLRALFTFTTPSSLFPPTAIITLTDDNSTSFLARPANFGPSLPAHGLSGQLWIGKGFGEQISLSDEELKASGFELGCSDVPGWNDDHKRRPENGAIDGKLDKNLDDNAVDKLDAQTQSRPSKRNSGSDTEKETSTSTDDGTDDYLHHPLPDSNPASPEKPGEPASIPKQQDKTKAPVHADIESLQESADIAGKVVMLSRGGCGFLEKVKWAQRRGGIAVIVGDNEPGGQLTIMNAHGDTSNITIPAIFTSYYSAHLLSTLVPPGEDFVVGSDGRSTQKRGMMTKSNDRDKEKASRGRKNGSKKTLKSDGTDDTITEKGWMQNVLSVVGLDDDTTADNDDSRRPPASGNIDWVLLEDWDEDKPATTSTSLPIHKAVKTASTSAKGLKAQATPIKKTGDDDFVIGVQDWRDTEVIAPKPGTVSGSRKQKGKTDATASQASVSNSKTHPTGAALKGGSITPGSGEYDHQKSDVNGRSRHSKNGVRVDGLVHRSLGERIASFFHHEPHKEIIHPRPDQHSPVRGSTSSKDGSEVKSDYSVINHNGLWVTLLPTSPSTSPFFDTLLVLVVSPLVTLTFVYGLLLLRSRIRRRRWRAPKSIVDRLPVRTYHTMSSTSSTTSSSLPSPQPSSTSSPALRPMTQSRTRPRSQTTTGVVNSSASSEKTVKSSPKRKRYNGRQVECVVCLEEYVDGESRVMSLPCGHEFHVECITPWLVTRRRTCPICKGDVVRSMARNGGRALDVSENMQEEDEQTSDDIQERAVMTENSEGSAAIPIPVQEVDETLNDIERGDDVETPLLSSTPRNHHGRWRGLLGGSISRLSGDTVWRSSVSDRTR